MKIATVSFNMAWQDKELNMIKIEQTLQSIKNKADYVIFPEMTLTGFGFDKMELAENIHSSTLILKLSKLAVENKLNILLGLLSNKQGKFYNSCIGINCKGKLEEVYNKTHLFSFACEDQNISPGKEIVSIPWEGKWGLSICYDLRFPELYQRLSEESLVLINIANWPSSRILHWKTLLRARAIENQSFMIGVNRTGLDGNNLKYEESSLVFSPSGEEISPFYENQDTKIYEVMPNMAVTARENFRVKNDRRIDLYRQN